MSTFERLYKDTDFEAEAYNYVMNGITDRAEIRTDIAECLRENLKDHDIYELPADFDELVDEYTNRVYGNIVNPNTKL